MYASYVTSKFAAQNLLVSAASLHTALDAFYEYLKREIFVILVILKHSKRVRFTLKFQ